ncbi:MAG TPA: XisI protein [Cyanobacteria bacterium UBA11149]|nr:XisI protein [Cyanobacteria bacterium UBA11367]HBE56338.1 XisI protein [Cyanobacteria bacterium UBA11366]HBK65948.1 XisI protein [Cyanobacteria bacterium UBA11166]HBR76259.1 XisI protein [Cyanobacteria bacterium UBA11159]HBS70494.1 XisI protein [Cyanobacteria bacterium UBA11153]HBW91850.1 XisI protein [Cyanobacteria bacterium UBA11149]HCA94780.1 XisI protein [Cyanobacteria bacterium UBA9226]
MDKINYSEVVQTVIKGHGRNCLNNNTEVQLIFDTERNRYQLLHIGWEGLSRVFGCIIYVEIKDGKIWIERDGTEIGVANELVEAGVPNQDIVLAFHAPYKRKFTEFAAS